MEIRVTNLITGIEVFTGNSFKEVLFLTIGGFRGQTKVTKLESYFLGLHAIAIMAEAIIQQERHLGQLALVLVPVPYYRATKKLDFRRKTPDKRSAAGTSLH